VPLIFRVRNEAELIAGTICGLTQVAVPPAWLLARCASRMNVVDALCHA
jgi:hypothetical protein